MSSGLGIVTAVLRDDGWYYTNIGYRFHAISDGEIFTKIWDLQKEGVDYD